MPYQTILIPKVWLRRIITLNLAPLNKQKYHFPFHGLLTILCFSLLTSKGIFLSNECLGMFWNCRSTFITRCQIMAAKLFHKLGRKLLDVAMQVNKW